jgi:1-acyl-sn-glycerol-3-phosphate acyltransferase
VSEMGLALARGGPATHRRSPAPPGRQGRPAPRRAPASPDATDRFYAAVRLVVRFWLWFCFKPVDVRHPERVPTDGPVLLCINHPNNLIDSLVVAAALRRKVHFLAAAAMFRNPLVARFLRACGAIPVYRKEDDPDKMDPNAKAFAACFQALEGGRLIAMYPEGTTHAEARVQRIKSGAARIALGHEAARPGELSLIPVGLTFEARKSFLGRVLVSFGEPIPVAPYLEADRQDPCKAVDGLTRAIQRAMEAELIGEIDAVNSFKARDPLRRERVLHSWVAIVGFPFFVYGAVVNGLPYLIPCWLARRLAKKETDYATVRFLASVVAFPLCWTLETWVVGWQTGAAGAAVFALSLPLTGLVAYRYLVGAGRLRSRLRFGVLR